MEPVKSIEEFVIETIAAICEIEAVRVTDGAPLSELTLDSLRIVALAAHIESRYACAVSPEDVLELLEAECVSDVVAIVRRLTDRRALAEP